MKAAEFRGIALSLEGAEEYDHAGLPAFRVGGRKFASLASQGVSLDIHQGEQRRDYILVEEQPCVICALSSGVRTWPVCSDR